MEDRNRIIALFGVAFIIIGIMAHQFSEKLIIMPRMELYGFIIPEVAVTQYPYRIYGIPMAVMGLIIVMIGLVIRFAPTPSSSADSSPLHQQVE